MFFVRSHDRSIELACDARGGNASILAIGGIMFFADAVKELASGEKIRRHGWEPGGFIQVDPLGFVFSPNLKAGGTSFWCPTISDLTASDWQIHVPRPGEPS